MRLQDDDSDDVAVAVRVWGSEKRCRELLDAIGQIAEVRDVAGPFRSKRGAPGVRFFAVATPRAAGSGSASPGSTPGEAAAVS